jgi:hypothetical protein
MRALTTAVFLTVVIGVWAQDESKTHLVVKVADPASAQTARAEIRIGRATDSIHPIVLADAYGQLTADLARGSYDLDVRSPGFKSYKVPLNLGQPQQSITVTLEIDQSGGPAIYVKTVSPPGPEIPLSNPADSRVPIECRSQVDHDTGVPFFFSAEQGVRYGASLKTNHQSESWPVSLFFWIDNEADQPVDFSSCTLFRNKPIDVWSRSTLRFLNRSNFEARNSGSDADSCSADFKIVVPARSCKVAGKFYLNEIYSLIPGLYTVTANTGGKVPSDEKKEPVGLTFQMRREARCREIPAPKTAGFPSNAVPKAEFPCGYAGR